MSPFTQLERPFTGGSNIDRNFSPILNYLDEFDRHFSHRHRFMNCFIPRFDLEEDASFYYLYGEIPGAKVEDINIEAHDDHTLVVSGTTHRPTPPNLAAMGSPAHEFVKVDTPAFHNGKYVENEGEFAGHAATQNYGSEERHHEHEQQKIEPSAPVQQVSSQSYDYPPPPQAPQPQAQYEPQAQSQQNPQQGQKQHFQGDERRVLLSERLVGDFHRTFAFPSPIAEDATKASVENGVLYLVVPKREVKKRLGRRIPILGSWGQGPAGEKYAAN